MDTELAIKINELIKLLDNSEVITELELYKKQIESDKNVKDLIDKFKMSEHNYIVNPTISNKKHFQNAKVSLYNNQLVKSYKYYENELYYFTLYINEQLNKLLNKHYCQKDI